MAVTPIPGVTSQVTVGGTSVVAIAANPNGGFITNPLFAIDQGLSVAEALYINPIGAATLAGNNQTVALSPGQTWTVIPGQTTPTYVNAASNVHKFTVVSW